VSPTATKYLTYRIGLDDSAAGTRDLQSCPLLLLVREVARSDSTPLPRGQATIPVFAGEPQGASGLSAGEQRSPPPLLHGLDRAANILRNHAERGNLPVVYLVTQDGIWGTGSDDVGLIQSTKAPKGK